MKGKNMTMPNVNAQLGVMIDNAPGADGTVWPRVQFLSGPTAFIFSVPPDVFRQFLGQIAAAGEEALKEADAANSGKKLAVASPADLHRIAGNGKRRG